MRSVPRWTSEAGEDLSQTEDEECPTWDTSGASDGLSQTENDAERPTCDIAEDGASPADGLFPARSELFRALRDEEEAEAAHAWQLVDEIAAGIKTRDRAATLARTMPPSVVRHVMARDQFRCSVPGCSMGIWKEVHPIQWRQDGGGHDIENLTVACSRHHKMLHRGLLTVFGTPSTGLVWRDRHGRILPGSACTEEQPALDKTCQRISPRRHGPDRPGR